MALNGLYCADVPLRNFAIGHSGASIVSVEPCELWCY